MSFSRSHIAVISLFALLVVSVGCDAVVPEGGPELVVESWMQTGEPLSPIRISQTQSLSAALSDARPADSNLRVEITLGDQQIQYERDESNPTWWIPFGAMIPTAESGDRFDLNIDRDAAESVTATGFMPPAIELLDVRVRIPDRPTPAILLDTLDVGLDSLDLDIDASTGFIYPVDVEVVWSNDGYDGWVEARLDPVTSFSSSIIDFFLLPSQVFIESNAVSDDGATRTWRGVYAIPVDTEDAPMPDHELDVVLLRGDARFARFATSRDAPERREPAGNVNGGLGFVGGISVDSTRVSVQQ